MTKAGEQEIARKAGPEMLEFIEFTVQKHRPKISFARLFGSDFQFAVLLFLFLTLAPATFSQEDLSESAEDAVALFNQGQDAHEKGDLKTALGLYDKALKVIPEFPEALLQKGNAEVSLKRYDDAERSFRDAVRLRSDWSLALAKLGEVLVRRHASLASSDPSTNPLYDEAVAILGKAIAAEPGSFPAFVALAELQLNSSRPQEELEATLKRIAALTDGKMNIPAALWVARASLENALGQKAQARTSISQALAADAANPAALYAAAEISLADGDTTQANALVARLERSEPVSANLTLIRAKVLLAEGKNSEAAKLLRSIENPARDAAALLEKISVVASQDKAQLERSLETAPKDAAILGRLCSLYRTEDPMRALEYCRRASEAEPGNISHAVGFGAAMVQAKRYDEAAQFLRKLSEYDPDNSTVHANLATALFQLKRLEEAKKEYRWLTEKQPAMPAAYYFLAITHDQLGEYADAMANYQQFLRLADSEKNKLEIEKVNLRLPPLQKQLKDKKGKSR